MLYVQYGFFIVCSVQPFLCNKSEWLVPLASLRSFIIDGVWKKLSGKGIKEMQLRVPPGMPFADVVHEITGSVCLMNYALIMSFESKDGSISRGVHIFFTRMKERESLDWFGGETRAARHQKTVVTVWAHFGSSWVKIEQEQSPRVPMEKGYCVDTFLSEKTSRN